MTKKGLQLLKAVSILLGLLEKTPYLSLDGSTLSIQAQYKDIVDLGSCGLCFASSKEFSFDPNEGVVYVLYIDLYVNFKSLIPPILKSDCYVSLAKNSKKRRP